MRGPRCGEEIVVTESTRSPCVAPVNSATVPPNDSPIRWKRRAATASATAESFFATLECELLARHRFRTQAQARAAIC